MHCQKCLDKIVKDAQKTTSSSFIVTEQIKEKFDIIGKTKIKARQKTVLKQCSLFYQNCLL